MERLPKSVLGCILASAGPIDAVVQFHLVCSRWHEALAETPLVVSFQGSRNNDLLPGRHKETTLRRVPLWREFNKYSLAMLDLRNVELEASLLADILSNVPSLRGLDVSNTQLSLGQVWSILNYKVSEREAMQGRVLDLRLLRAANNRSVNLSVETLTKVFPRLERLHFGNTEFSSADLIQVLRALPGLQVLDVTYAAVDWARIEAEEVGQLLSEGSLQTFLVHELPPSLENVFLGLQVQVVKDTVPQVLSECTSEEDVDRLARLLALGADPNITCPKTHSAYSDFGSYPVLRALQRVSEEALGLQLMQTLCSYNLDLSYHQQEEPFTVLQGCVEREFVSLVALLLRCGVDMIPVLNSATGEFPAVCKAATLGEEGVLQAFIDLELHNHPIPKAYCDLICSAIQSGKESVLELVLEHGAKMRRCKNHPNFLLRSPEALDSILRSEYREAINISPDMIYEALQFHTFLRAENTVERMVERTLELLDLRANEEVILSERQPSGQRSVLGSYNFHKPVLIIAVVSTRQERKCADLVRFLLEAGFDINAADGMGWTALIAASSCGYLEFIGFLCSKGAMINKRDSGGRTALHQAAHNGHAAVVAELLKYGATAAPMCSQDLCPLDLALLNGHKEVVAVLKPLTPTLKKKRACEIW